MAGVVVALIVSVGPSLSASPKVTGQDSAGTAADHVVTDDVGQEVKIPAEVKRIVTLAPNLTETIYALGLEDRLAGDTDFCDTPAAAKLKPHVGNPQNPSLEAIVALHPDLVLATDSINRVDTADALKRLGIAVYTTGGDTQTVLHILDSIGRVADLIGAEPQGTELVASMRQRLDALHARLEDRPLMHVLFVVWEQPLTTIGQNTFIADALRWAGAESVVLSRQNWPQMSIEEVVRLQPDYIVFTSDHSGTGTAATELADLRSRPAWRDLDAVEQGHVADVSEEALRPSPGLVDAIEQLAHEFHPDLFSVSEDASALSAKYRSELLPIVGAEISPRCSQCAR
jgi:iron complex transport system substrate-binding protein